jgi:protein-L-isoaspartate(D-aspartate) O-methyltransferase
MVSEQREDTMTGKPVTHALLFIILAVGTSWVSACHRPSQDESFDTLRRKMVEDQIAVRGVTDQNVLRAMQTVPRHQFVPSGQVPHAYEDRPLPIGYDQTISQPYIVAFMTEILNLRKHDRVLEVGTGSGYQAAVLAEIVDSVFTIEIVSPLAESARRRLSALGYNNVVVREGDGYNGWPDHAPFDAIMVTAAAEQIPQPLIDQLKEGGRMIIPAGGVGEVQELVLVEKRRGEVTFRNVLPVRFVPLVRP